MRKTFWTDVAAPNATVFISSMGIMMMELTAGRIISRHLGQSLYTWTSVIGIVLAGISLGNYIGGLLADRFQPKRTLTVLFFLASLSSLTIPWMNGVVGQWLFLLEREWPTRILLHVFATFIVPSALLGMISPVVAKMALVRAKSTGRTIGGIYAWGTAGSIIGTFLAGFWLIALMGAPALLALVAAVMAAMGVLYGLGSWWPKAWLVLSLVALFGAAGQSEAARKTGARFGLRDANETDPNCVYSDESQYSHIAVYGLNADKTLRSIMLDRLTHSKIDIDDPSKLKYEYLWVYEGVVDRYWPERRPVSAFVIGGGGYAFPQYLEVTRPGSRIAVAEIDPEVTRAAFEAFGLRRDTRMEIYNMDARNCVDDMLRARQRGESVEPFDCIFGDSINNFSVPYHLTTREFAQSLHDLLADDGKYILNFIDIGATGRFLGAIVSTLSAVFPHVAVMCSMDIPHQRDTFVVTASKQPLDFDGLADAIRARHPKFRGRLLTDEEVVRYKDAVDGLVLTDDFAPVDFLLADVVRVDNEDLFRKYVKLGVAAMNRGDYDRALDIFERMRTRAPKSSDGYANIGLVYTKMGQWQKARRVYEDGLARDPASPSIRSSLAILDARDGQLDSARATLADVLDAQPSFVPALNAMALLEMESNPEHALELFARAAAVAPSDVTAHYYLGALLAERGHLEAASRHATMARNIDPTLRDVLRIPLPPSGTNTADVMKRLLF